MLENTFFPRTIYSFAFVMLVTVLLAYIQSTIVITDEIRIDMFLIQGYSEEMATSFLEKTKQYTWLGYCISIFFLIIGIFFTSLCIKIGFFISDKNVGYSDVLKAVVVGQIVWFIPSLIQIFWFYFIQTTYSFEDIQSFYSFTLVDIIDKNDSTYSYFLGFLSIFGLYGLLYCVTISLVLSSLQDNSWSKYFLVVLLSYISGSMIVQLFLTFLTIIYS